MLLSLTRQQQSGSAAHGMLTDADIIRQGPLDAAPALADGGQVLASFQDQRSLRKNSKSSSGIFPNEGY